MAKRKVEGKDHYKLFFGTEITVCKEALVLERDSLLAQYMLASDQGTLTPDSMSSLSKKYRTCIKLLARIGAGYEHGLTMRESDTWPADKLNAAAVLEYGTYQPKAEGETA